VRRSTPPSSIAEPVWRRLGRRRPGEVPGASWSWLADTGSLTRRLQAACAGRFEVRLLRQAWGSALPSERRVLGHRGRALIREVELLCDGVPRVFARTVIPYRSLSGAARQLGRLGVRPLGAVLFANPSTRRGVVEFARLSPAEPLFAEAVAHLPGEPPAALWGRRTLYYYAGRPLLVNEIFLPSLLV